VLMVEELGARTTTVVMHSIAESANKKGNVGGGGDEGVKPKLLAMPEPHVAMD